MQRKCFKPPFAKTGIQKNRDSSDANKTPFIQNTKRILPLSQTESVGAFRG